MYLFTDTHITLILDNEWVEFDIIPGMVVFNNVYHFSFDVEGKTVVVLSEGDEGTCFTYRGSTYHIRGTGLHRFNRTSEPRGIRYEVSRVVDDV